VKRRLSGSRVGRYVAVIIAGCIGSVVFNALSASGASGPTFTASRIPSGQTVAQIDPFGKKVLWAWTQNQAALTGGGQEIELTVNGGTSWENVTPPRLGVESGNHWINGFFALSPTRAWIVYGGVDKEPQTIESTSDGGRHWSAVGQLPKFYCGLQFTSTSDGTCTVYAGAGGSMGIAIYRTVDGGAHWTHIFNSYMTEASLNKRTPKNSLPFECDKSIDFMNATKGWALFYCNADLVIIYRTTDGGVKWTPSEIAPASLKTEGGGFPSPFVLSGRRGAVGYEGGKYSVVYVTGDGGASFHAVSPPGQRRPWNVDVLTPRVWRLAYKTTIMATNDAGKSWFTVHSDANSVSKPRKYAASAPQVIFATDTRAWLIQNNELLRTTDGGKVWKRVPVPGTSQVD
jgi:photosystem II stability/assembly factor-like uncharacterized protein